MAQIFSGNYTPLSYFFLALSLAAFVFEAWAFIDVIIRPPQAFLAAGKRTKQIWLLITGVAAVLGLASATGYLGAISFLAVAAFVGAAVYMADVRPKVKEFRKSRTGTGNGNGSWGPYGPW